MPTRSLYLSDLLDEQVDDAVAQSDEYDNRSQFIQAAVEEKLEADR